MAALELEQIVAKALMFFMGIGVKGCVGCRI